MRLSAFFSLAVHAGVVTAGLFMGYDTMRPPEQASPMIIIPLELMTIGDVTDIAPVVEAKELEDEAAVEETEAYAAAAPAPPPVEEDTVNLDEPKPDPKKDEAHKKADAKPAPPKKTEDDFDTWLNQTLADNRKEAPKSAPAPAGKTATTEKAPPHMGAGEMRRTQVTVTDYIRAQLINKRCWTDHSDMADAQRLTATFRVRFSASGKFAAEPELREPSREPFNDPPMQVYIQHARTALAKCNQLGWQIPPEYFKLQPAPYWIDLTFVPKVGAVQ